MERNSATITIDDIAREAVSQERPRNRGWASILEELQRKLQDKGDDPRYDRVVFASDHSHFYEIRETSVRLAGVFPRYSATPFEKNDGMINTLFGNLRRNSLVVASNDAVSKYWEEKLKALDYTVRII